MIIIDFSGLSWYFLISAAIVTFALIVFNGILIGLHYQKRTGGTALLLIFYCLITLAEIGNTFGLWYFAFISQEGIVSSIFELSFVLFYATGYLFLYFFANRHILRDSDGIKAITAIVLSLTVGITFGIMIAEVIYNVPNPIFSIIIPLTRVNIDQTLPSFLGGAILLLPILSAIHLRIVIKIIKLRKTLEKGVTRAGFTAILFSIIAFIASTLFATGFTLPGIENYPFVIVTFHTLRTLSILVGLILGYIGWVLPVRFRNAVAKHYNVPIEEE